MRISDWSSDVCSADLIRSGGLELGDVNDRLFLEHGARIGADRDRNRLQAFLGFSRDDDDFLNAAAIGMLRFIGWRSEEHTSELQSLMRISYAVFCLKKKTSADRRMTSYDSAHI